MKLIKYNEFCWQFFYSIISFFKVNSYDYWYKIELHCKQLLVWPELVGASPLSPQASHVTYNT